MLFKTHFVLHIISNRIGVLITLSSDVLFTHHLNPFNALLFLRPHDPVDAILLHTLCSKPSQLSSVVSLCQKKRPNGPFGWRMSQDLEKTCKETRSKGSTLLVASDRYIEKSVKAIKDGKVIAVPTDTLYGFACDACSAAAINQIYEVKGRKLTSPLAICVADVSDIPRFAIVDGLPCGLLDGLLPGPVTIVLRRDDSSILEKSLNPGLDSIGVRVPDNNFIRAIARGSGGALALTSANLTGQASSISPKDFEHLWHHCEYVFDGGLLQDGRAGSTVVDLTKPGAYKILRPGSARDKTVAVLHSFSLEEGN
ncbi:hypothetical protein MA16_Dca000847 [Dendrobium catenatum]|uniref:Threonylcarbamoyl-AMP synthase n=2 Tax=Dendrobium catenatum TaxID=906689 RepID=A0A2I0WV29_9ASPA|nr:hypothetical protein MA16_Dca000847 [Dendrobium catenatum]